MSNILAPFQLLELNVISAQDLAPVARSMRTYAVAWVHPDRKLSTRVDTHGHNNPTWNDKFVFRVDDEFLYSDTSAIMIEIYALHWFRDVYVGTVRVLIGNLIPPPSKLFTNTNAPLGMRFVAVQVRRASGRPQGILNIGVAVLDSSMRSMPLYTHNPSAIGYRHLMGETDDYSNQKHLSPNRFAKPELRRTKSDTSSRVTAQQNRIKGKNGRASSVATASEVSYRNRRQGRSKGSSLVSGSDVSNNKNGKSGSVISDSLFSWKGKKGKTSSLLSGSDIVKVSWNKDKIIKPSPIVNRSEHVKSPGKRNSKHGKINHHINVESSTSTSETATTTTSGTAEEKQGQFPINNNAYEVKASSMLQYRNSPSSQQFRNSPKLNLAKGLAGSHRGTPRTTPLHPNTPMHMHPKPFRRFNGSFEYGTPRRSNLGAPPVMTESELGPSPSEVAAEMAKVMKIDEGENSRVGGLSLDESVEGLRSKLERWRTELPPVYDRSEPSTLQTSSKDTHRRRHTDGGDGLFSCFSNICGCECSIVCGGGDERKNGRRRRSPSAENLSFI